MLETLPILALALAIAGPTITQAIADTRDARARARTLWGTEVSV